MLFKQKAVIISVIFLFSLPLYPRNRTMGRSVICAPGSEKKGKKGVGRGQKNPKKGQRMCMDVMKLMITATKDRPIPSTLACLSNQARTFSKEPSGLANRN